MSRDHNGYIRETAVNKLVQSSNYFIIPFIALQFGEYISEINEIIRNSRDFLDKKAFKRFFHDNPDFLNLTKARVRSYWNRYYSTKYKNFEDYTPNKILKYLGV